MIIYIYGADTFRSRKYLREMVEQFKKKRDPQGYNVVFVDAQKQPEKILGEILTAPFLAEKRMIIVENVLSISDKELLAGLMERIAKGKTPESNVVVFWQGEKTRSVSAKGGSPPAEKRPVKWKSF